MIVDILLVERWLIPGFDRREFENWLGNQIVFPDRKPQTAIEEKWFAAYLREVARLRKLAGEDIGAIAADIANLISDKRQAVSVILDGLEPEGILNLGSLGPVVAPSGKVGDDITKIAVEIIVDIGVSQKQKLVIPMDTVSVIPFGAGEKKGLKLSLKNGYKLLGKNSIEVELVCGDLGIIIDTRGRPLIPPSADPAGRKRLERWNEVWETR